VGSRITVTVFDTRSSARRTWAAKVVWGERSLEGDQCLRQRLGRPGRAAGHVRQGSATPPTRGRTLTPPAAGARVAAPRAASSCAPPGHAISPCAVPRAEGGGELFRKEGVVSSSVQSFPL